MEMDISEAARCCLALPPTTPRPDAKHRCQEGVATVPSPSPPDTRQELGRNTHTGWKEGWEEASEVELGAESIQATGLCDHPQNPHNHCLEPGCKEHITRGSRTSSHRHAGQE